MVGNKLFNLLNELNVSQNKILIHRCSSSSDKRLAILKTFLVEGNYSLKELNNFLTEEVKKTWPNSSLKEQDLKVRRLSNFFSELIEKLILETYLEKNSSIKNLLLAQSIEKNGNLNLLNHYYEKAYSKSMEEEDFSYQMLSLKGRIRMHYASHNEKELEQALQLNEELLKILRHANNDKITEYYYNISNIYLERMALVKHKKETIETEIKAFIENTDYALNKISLYVSLAKLNFNNENLEIYFDKAKEILNGIENKNNEYFDLERKMRFLELRLNFFSGKELNQLIDIANDIMKDSKAFSIINNNTLFYKILFLALDNQVEEAQAILDESHSYFKGNAKILDQFLQAFIFIKNEDYKKAIQLLQTTMYATNYFIAIFSRLLVIKIHTQRKNTVLAKSIIESTSRLLKVNQGNPLGMEANEYVLKHFKKNAKNGKSVTKLSTPKLTILHNFIIS